MHLKTITETDYMITPFTLFVKGEILKFRHGSITNSDAPVGG